MGRILALDIGKRRIGMATTDALQMIASPLKTVDAQLIWKVLNDEIQSDLPEVVVIGMPVGLDGGATDGTEFALKFQANFEKKFPKVRLERADERFTSKMALDAMHVMGMKTKGNKARIDEMSAALILQGYLERKGK